MEFNGWDGNKLSELAALVNRGTRVPGKAEGLQDPGVLNSPPVPRVTSLFDDLSVSSKSGVCFPPLTLNIFLHKKFFTITIQFIQ